MSAARAAARVWPLLALLGAIVGADLASGPARAAEAAMSVELPAGQWKTLKLRNLPQDAVMAVVVQATGRIAVMLVNEADFRRFPKAEDPVFMGTVEKRLSFTVTIPATGTYFMVFDNRQSATAQKVKFLIRAERGAVAPEQKAPPAVPPAPPAPAPAPDQRRPEQRT